MLAVLGFSAGMCLAMVTQALAVDARLLTTEVFDDGSDSKTAGDGTASRAWQAVPKGGFVGGYTPGTLWFRLRVAGPRGQQGIIFVLSTCLDELTSHIPQPQVEGWPASQQADGVAVYYQGDTPLASNRADKWRGFAVPLQFSGTEGEAYVRLKTNSSVLFWPQADTQVGFAVYLQVESLIAGALALGLLATLLIGIVRWRLYGHASSASIAAYAFSALLLLLVRDGCLALVIAEAPEMLHRGVGFSIGLLLVATIASFRNVIQASLLSQLLDRVSYVALVISLTVAAAAALGVYGAVAFHVQLFALAAIFGLPPIGVLRAWRQRTLRHPLAHACGLVAILPGFTLTFLLTAGLIGLSPLTFYSSEAALLISLLFKFVSTAAESRTTKREHKAMKAQLDAGQMIVEINRQAAETYGNWFKVFGHQDKIPLAVIKMSSQNIAGLDPRSEIHERSRKISSNVGKFDSLVRSLTQTGGIRKRFNERRDHPFDALELALSRDETLGLDVAVRGLAGAAGRHDADIRNIALGKLVSNAHIHSGTPTSVNVEVAKKAWKGRGGIAFHVRDAGPVLSGDVKVNMSVRHWRGRNSKGHDIGLWAASLIADAHGGRLFHERTGSEHSQFSIWIPE